jgi:hypothetical protein
MNAFLIAAIPMLCCAAAFTVIGASLGDVTFLAVGGGFLAAGIPLLTLGLQRRQAEKSQ